MNTHTDLIPYEAKAEALVPAFSALSTEATRPRQTSQLALLPSELVIQIAQYMHITDINSLQLTCSRFYWIQPMMPKQHPMHNYLSYLTKPGRCVDFFCFCCNEPHRENAATASPHRLLAPDVDPTWGKTSEVMAVSLSGWCNVQFQHANSVMNSLRYGPRQGDVAASVLQKPRATYELQPDILRKGEGWKVRVVDGQLMVRHELRVRGFDAEYVDGLVNSLGTRFLCKHHQQNLDVARTKRICASIKIRENAAAAAAAAVAGITENQDEASQLLQQAYIQKYLLEYLQEYPQEYPQEFHNRVGVLRSCDSCHTDSYVAIKQYKSPRSPHEFEIWAVSYFLLGYCDVPWEPIWREHGTFQSTGSRKDHGMPMGAVYDMWHEGSLVGDRVQEVPRHWATEPGPIF